MTWLLIVVALSASGLKTGVRYFATEQQCENMVQEISAAVQFNGNWRCIKIDPSEYGAGSNTPIELDPNTAYLKRSKAAMERFKAELGITPSAK